MNELKFVKSLHRGELTNVTRGSLMQTKITNNIEVLIHG